MIILRVVDVRCHAAFIAGLALTVAGCQPSVGATATGTISINGKPAPAGIVVRFQPQVPRSSASIGVTDAAGRYDLRFNARIRGVMPGESVVSLSIAAEPGANGKSSLPKTLEQIRIPAAFGERSTLTKVVEPGANVIDIDISL